MIKIGKQIFIFHEEVQCEKCAEKVSLGMGVLSPCSHQCQVSSFKNGIIETIQNICERLGLSSQTFPDVNKFFSYDILKAKKKKNVVQKFRNLKCSLHIIPHSRALKELFFNFSITVWPLNPTSMPPGIQPSNYVFGYNSKESRVRHFTEGPWP